MSVALNVPVPLVNVALAGSTGRGIRAGEVNRAGVAGCCVCVQRVLRGHRDTDRGSRHRDGRRRDDETRRRPGADHDVVAGAGDGRRHRIGGRDRLRSRRPERRAECADTVDERHLAGKRRAAVAGGEMHGAAVTGDNVVQLVQRVHGGGERRCTVAAGRCAHREARCRSGTHDNGVACARDRRRHRVGRPDRLRAGGDERRAERAHAVGR